MTKFLYLIIAIIFSFLVFGSAYGNEGISIEKVYSRYICASLLLSYSLAHLYILARKGAYFHKVLSFLPLYLVFGLIYSFASIGYIKGWAPGTSEQAFISNIKYGSTLVFIVMCWLFTIFYSGVNTPNKQINKD